MNDKTNCFIVNFIISHDDATSTLASTSNTSSLSFYDTKFTSAGTMCTSLANLCNIMTKR